MTKTIHPHTVHVILRLHMNSSVWCCKGSVHKHHSYSEDLDDIQQYWETTLKASEIKHLSVTQNLSLFNFSQAT